MPAHFDVEVYASLRRLFRRGLLARTRLDLIAVLLRSLAAERVALTALMPEAHRLADRLAAPDAFYVALARAQSCELITADARLAAAGSSLARVWLVA